MHLPKKLSLGKDLQIVYQPKRNKYAKAINSKAQPFPSEPLIMALLFSQPKMIEWLEQQISKPKINILKPLDESINAISQNYRLSD
jgi:hypothetical protein